MKAIMTNWKTTSAGIASIIGGGVRMYFAYQAGELSEEAIMTTVTAVLVGVGLIFARDGNKSSAQSGAE